MQDEGSEGDKGPVKKAPGISFGLSAGSSRRPGVKSGRGGLQSSLLTAEAGEGGTDSQAGDDKAGGRTPLAIPALANASGLFADAAPRMTPSGEATITAYDPYQYGLQVRSPSTKAASSPVGTELSPSERSAPDQRMAKVLPDPVGLATYEQVPVEEFGAALLRGMGWREGEGIGPDGRKGPTEPILPKFRFKGLGLGAELDATEACSPGRKSPSSHIEVATSRLQRGVSVEIVTGEHAGLWGVVNALDPKIVTVRLVESEELVYVPREQIRLGTPSEQRSPLEENLAIEETFAPEAGSSWLLPHIRVRFTSKVFQQGVLYRKTGDILDIATDETGITRAVIRLHDGRLVGEVHQAVLEPLPPSREGTAVTILRGPHRGEVGTALGMGYRGDQSALHVQLRDSMEIVLLSVSEVAEACMHME